MLEYIESEYKIEVINIREYMTPYKGIIEADGNDFDTVVSAVHAFVLPEKEGTIHISDAILDNETIVKRYVAHEGQHLTDHKNGVIDMNMLTGKSIDDIDLDMSLLSESRAMTAEGKFMTIKEYREHVAMQFVGRNIYGFDKFTVAQWDEAFSKAELDLFGERLSKGWEDIKIVKI